MVSIEGNMWILTTFPVSLKKRVKTWRVYGYTREMGALFGVTKARLRAWFTRRPSVPRWGRAPACRAARRRPWAAAAASSL